MRFTALIEQIWPQPTALMAQTNTPQVLFYFTWTLTSVALAALRCLPNIVGSISDLSELLLPNPCLPKAASAFGYTL